MKKTRRVGAINTDATLTKLHKEMQHGYRKFNLLSQEVEAHTQATEEKTRTEMHGLRLDSQRLRVSRKAGAIRQRRCVMPKDHRLKTQKHPLPIMVPLNFLLGCSQQSLDAYELARLAECSDLRKEFHSLFDRLIEQSALTILARWFRQSDRDSINQAIALEESPTKWAKRQIKEGQRSGDDDLLPLPSLTPGAAHLAAAIRYAERNIAEGKCSVCPQQLDRNSVRYCTKHLTAARHSHEKKGRAAPGSREYLYSEEKQPSMHGRKPGTLAALAMAREKATRKVLAELGIPPESAAVSLNAAKEALLAHLPRSEARALTTAALFKTAMIPSRTTGQNAIRELLSEGRIQRAGKGSMRDVFRYFAKPTGTVFDVPIDRQVG